MCGRRTAWQIARSAACAPSCRKEGGVTAGSDQTAIFSVDNAPNGPPTVRILNQEFYKDPLFDQDSVDIRLLLGDPEWGPVDVTIAYDAGAGGTLEGVASFPAASDTGEQIRRIGIAGLPNSNVGVLRAFVSDGTSVGSASTPPSRRGRPAPQGLQRSMLKAVGTRRLRERGGPFALTGHSYWVEFTHPLRRRPCTT